MKKILNIIIIIFITISFTLYAKPPADKGNTKKSSSDKSPDVSVSESDNSTKNNSKKEDDNKPEKEKESNKNLPKKDTDDNSKIQKKPKKSSSENSEENVKLALGQEKKFDSPGKFDITVKVDKLSVLISIPELNAHKYVIYRSTEENGTYQKTGLIRELSFTDDQAVQGISYYYIVVALKKSGNKWVIAHSKPENVSIKKIPVDHEIKIVSDPPNAVVIINNENAGETPLSVKLKSGTYQITIQKENYKTYKNMSFNINLDSKKELNIILQKITADIQISSEPAGAEISINGKKIGPAPIKAKDLSIGTYTLSAEKSGYSSSSRVVEIKNENTQAIYITLQKNIKYGSLDIKTSPADAQIFLDNVKKGASPLIINNIVTGMHLLEIKKAGYNNIKAEVIIESDAAKQLYLTMVKEFSYFTLNTDPLGAECYLDGTEIGITPIHDLKINPGNHQLSIKMKNYNEYNENFALKIEDHFKRDIVLSIRKAKLLINSEPAGAAVMINDNHYGYTPFITENLQPGNITLKLIKSNYITSSKDFSVSAGQEKNFNLKLEPVPIPVKISKIEEAVKPQIPDEKITKKNKIPVPDIVTETKNITENTKVDDTVSIQKNIITKESNIINKTTIEKPQEIKQTPEIKKTDIHKTETVQIIEKPVLPKTGNMTLYTTPSDAKVYINKAYYGTTPYAIELDPMVYTIHIVKDDYQTHNETIDIQPGKVLTKNIDLTKIPSRIKIDSTPQGARVILNNQDYGTTPLDTAIASGTYILQLNLDKYKTYSASVTVPTKSPAIVRANLEKLPVKFTFSSSPVGAEIAINSKVIGFSPCAVMNLKDGTYLLTASKSGYRNSSQQITIENSQPLTFNLQLTPLQGDLLINTTVAQAEIYINNRKAGSSGKTIKNIQAGYHNITIKKFGYYDVKMRILINDAQLTTQNITLVEKPKGNLSVQTEPPGARIFLNSMSFGLSPALLNDIPEDSYQARLKLKGYKSYNVQIQIKGGETANLNAILTEGSDCCLGNTFFKRPGTWFVMSVLFAAGSGYSYYMEDESLKNKNTSDRTMYHDIRNISAYISGGCLMMALITRKF